MDMIQYQYVWHKAGSSVSNLEIFMSKMHFNQSLEKSMKSWKKLSKIGTLTIMIGKERKYRLQNSFKPFEESWIQKKNTMFGCHMIWTVKI